MRYLHVLESLARGGVETTFLHMLRVFRTTPSPDGTADVHEVLAFASGPLHRELSALANRVIVSSLPLDLAAVLSNDYDVIHILSERCAHRLAPMVLATSDAALVYSKSYDGPAMARMQGCFDHAADESLLAASDAITFTTLDLAAGYRVPPGRATILRKAAAIAGALALPPIDPYQRVDRSARPPAADRRHGDERASGGSGEVPLRILTVANLHPRKRLADLIPVMQLVRQRLPGAELRIVGGGPAAQVNALRDRIMDAGLSGAIALAGPQPEIERELASARVLAVPSAAEGVPTVVLEAMAAARPVVAMRVGHIGHVMTDGCEGFLAAPGDLTGFSVRLITLLEHPELAQRMGAAGRVRAGAHDVRTVAGDLLRVLRRAATARRRAAA